MTDTQILQRIAGGDQQAFEVLYRDYHLRVFNTAIGLVQHHQDAEEMVQNVFVEVYRSASQFEGRSKISTWVYQITVNKSLDLIRYKNGKKDLYRSPKL